MFYMQTFSYKNYSYHFIHCLRAYNAHYHFVGTSLVCYCLAAHYADAIGPCYGIPNYCDVWVSIYSFLSMLDLFQMVGSCQQSFCKSDNFHFVLGDICI